MSGGTWPHWAVGDADELAEAFITATAERGRSLGTRAYVRFVAAIASASVHNTFAQAIDIGDEAKRHVNNILLTARAVERQAAARILSETEDGAAGGSERYADDGSMDEDDVAIDTPQLESLEAAVQEVIMYGSGDVVTRGWLRTFAPPETLEDLGVGCCLLILPNVVIQTVMSRMDDKSAAVASTVCRQLNLVHRLNRFFELSAPFRCYLAALVHLQDDFSDGSVESEFYVHFPLDGSPVCGQDLAAESYNRRMRATLPEMAQLFALLGGAGRGSRSLADFKSSISGEEQLKRPPPSPLSTPLAFFKTAKAVPMMMTMMMPTPSPSIAYSFPPPAAAVPAAAAADAAVVVGPDDEDLPAYPASASAAAAAFTAATAYASAASAAAAPPVSSCCLSNAMCDVQEVRGVPSGRLHCDGDLVSVAYARGLKLHDAGLSALVLGSGADLLQYDNLPQYDRHGLSSHVTRLCSDSTNGLVWGAMGDGRRIKAFRAPVPVATPLAGCNRGEPNGMSLQYTLCSEVGGLGGHHAGLHVIGTRVVSVKGSGAILVWDVANMSPQQKATAPGVQQDDAMVMEDDSNESVKDLLDDGVKRTTRGPLAERREGRMGVLPHVVAHLPVPSSRGDPSASSLLAALAGEDRRDVIQSTCLLLDEATSVPPTLVAALGGNIVVTYDLETQRVKQRLFGHLYDITEIAAPPPAWRQPSLFATSSRSGDVKVWDVRMRGGAAAVTLTTGATDPINTVVLAAASSGGGATADGPSGSGGSGSGGRLGAGMVCFAGGDGESIWAWDLRTGHARPLYELSTGNTAVQSLVWHQAGNSLLAACESSWELADDGGAPGYNLQHDWKLDRDDGAGGGGGLGSSGPGSGDSNAMGTTETGAYTGSASTHMDGDSRAPSNDAMDEGSTAGDPGDDTRSLLLAAGRRRLWPARAKHQPGDFGVYFNMARSCVLRYRFSEQAKRDVPRSVAPSLASSD